jgi:hypothetical protein
MTGDAEPELGDDAVADVVYVVLMPTGELLEQRVDGRPDADDPDLEVPYQSVLWAAVDAVVAPGGEGVCGLAVPEQDMRAKVVDAAAARSRGTVFPPNPYASAVLTILGLRLEKSVRGAVVIVREEDAESGLTGSLADKQLEAIRAAHRTVVTGAGEAARWRMF